jgi:tetratricopeptide (TPR) repeat protein
MTRKVNYKRPIYEAGAIYQNRGSLRRASSTWMWGCGFLTAMSCVGLCVVMLFAVPIGFRLLSVENQQRVLARLPFMRIFQPTREVVALPTLDSAQATADAARFFGTPAAGTPRAATVTPTFLPTATFEPLPATFRQSNVRWVAQKWNNCGPANLSQGLQAINISVTQEEAAAWLKPDKLDANVSPWQLAAYAERYAGARALVRVNGDITLLKRLVNARMGVIVETGLYDEEDGQWLGHYVTIVGWNDTSGYLLGLDTLKGDNDGRGIPELYADFDALWQHFNRTYIVLFRPDQESRLREILGLAWDEQRNIQMALETALREASQQRDNPFAWFNVGTNYVMLGNYAEAAAAYNVARAAGGGWPWRMLWYQFGPYVAYFHLGDYQTVINFAINTERNTKYVEETFYYRAMAYAATGAVTQAKSELQRAITFNGNFEAAKQALNQLQNGQKPTPQML